MPTSIDRSRYIHAPNGSARQLMSLARVLLQRAPEHPSPDLAAAAETVQIELSRAQGVLVDRIRNFGPAAATLDREDDGHADTVLKVVRTRLEDWQLFTRPTSRRIVAARPQLDPLDSDKLANAALAGKVLTKLFATGFHSTRAPYAEQAEYMLTLERIIEEEQLEQPLIELVGAPFYVELRDAITLYAKMVARRQSGDGSNDTALYDSRIALRQATQNYLLALLAMIRDDDPDNVAAIRRALGPVDAHRASLARRPATGGEALDAELDPGLGEGGEASDGLDGLDPSALAELDAEQQQLDAELGLADGAGGLEL